jgi:hypothetical protein
MSKGAAGAIALILLWVSFASFFVAVHPGGITINGHPAQNPRDVIMWLIQRLSKGVATGPTQLD